MLKCAIFDMDGTIADTVPLCVAAFRHSVEPILGRPVPDDEILTTFGPSEEGTIRALVPDHYEEGLARYLEQYRLLHGIVPAPFDGIVELLHLLKAKGIILAIVTGKGPQSLEISMDVFGFSGIFAAIETGSPLGPNKSANLHEVLRKFDLHPKDCVYIGDTPGDITACREVGVPIVSVAWAPATNVEQLRSLKPDEICLTVEELKRYLTENIVETNKKRAETVY